MEQNILMRRRGAHMGVGEWRIQPGRQRNRACVQTSMNLQTGSCPSLIGTWGTCSVVVEMMSANNYSVVE